MLRRMEDWEKPSLYPPELQVYHPPPYNHISVLMKSKKYAMPPDENQTCTINMIRVGRDATVFHSKAIYDMIKEMIRITTEEYYDTLQKTEMYELPEHLQDGKIMDTIITFGGKE